MEIYNDEYLKITFIEEKHRFINYWNKSPNEEIFKKSMLIYVNFLKSHKPKQSLWILEKFYFKIQQSLRNWVEENVNVIALKLGVKKVAFVVSNDLLVQLSVINSFEENESVYSPQHFSTKKDAEDWLNGVDIFNSLSDVADWKIDIDEIDESGNVYIKIKQPGKNIVETIRSFKSIIERKENTYENNEKLSLLTKREKEILILYADGISINLIAQNLNISVHTVRTHWKKIRKKLNLKNFKDALELVENSKYRF